MTPRGGARKGAGRPPRQEPKTLPIWCGQMAEQDRALILEMLTPAERYTALMDAVAVKGYMMEGEGNMNYTIDSDKLDEVVSLFNDQVDPEATTELIESEICGDWLEGDEHQNWIDSAPIQDIVDWLASFYS